MPGTDHGGVAGHREADRWKGVAAHRTVARSGKTRGGSW
jgi:hypothetical protein